ncbi:PREDICTED: protein phosphatase 1 regulatory subunit 1B-like [Cyprinodon variegatus]|uniref:protein phosphatase 1 regulatory subunit 1B-like n=1 Tax=Cyprinodon variegatus TaxID=28743 RepID=UPI0007424E49|nr:PREDICTED: protein phosphatase 1 regulatory subunit 1B-like [Cyprinodon variegatus]
MSLLRAAGRDSLKVMEPLLPTEPEMMERAQDRGARKKIHFSVPSSLPLQLDPLQVEMIRRRRPTPATLFKLSDPPSPEEDSSSHQWVLGENGAMKAKLVQMATYQPPSLKAVQMMAEAHLKSLHREEPSSEDEQHRDDEKQQIPSVINSGEESKPLSDHCDLLGCLATRADLSKDATKELEEEKSENDKERQNC